MLILSSMSHIRYSPDRLEWHVGEKVCKEKLAKILLQENFSLQADGDELEWIGQNFKNLPMGRARVQTWFGDDARFIAAQLPLD